ncbi:MAG: nicotinamide-nucleotide amidohydrolase family protein [Planctomycetota bacterium]
MSNSSTWPELMTETLIAKARAVFEALQRTDERLALAESCTCGMLAASLGAIPGVSDRFCGSAVVYRESTKRALLSVDDQSLATHSAESEVVTHEMAQGVVQVSPETSLGLAITGHLGPNAPAALDGTVFLCLVRRQLAGEEQTQLLATETVRLNSAERPCRQIESATRAWDFLLRNIDL